MLIRRGAVPVPGTIPSASGPISAQATQKRHVEGLSQAGPPQAPACSKMAVTVAEIDRKFIEEGHKKAGSELVGDRAYRQLAGRVGRGGSVGWISWINPAAMGVLIRNNPY